MHFIYRGVLHWCISFTESVFRFAKCAMQWNLFSSSSSTDFFTFVPPSVIHTIFLFEILYSFLKDSKFSFIHFAVSGCSNIDVFNTVLFIVITLDKCCIKIVQLVFAEELRDRRKKIYLKLKLKFCTFQISLFHLKSPFYSFFIETRFTY